MLFHTDALNILLLLLLLIIIFFKNHLRTSAIDTKGTFALKTNRHRARSYALFSLFFFFFFALIPPSLYGDIVLFILFCFILFLQDDPMFTQVKERNII